MTRLVQWTLAALARVPYRWVRAVLWLVAPLLAKFGDRRAIIERNLELCFPAQAADARAHLASANFRSTLLGVYHALLAFFASDAAVRRRLEVVEGIDHLHHALAAGRGVLLITAHGHHIELAARLLALVSGRRLAALAREHNYLPLRAALNAARERRSGPAIEKKDLAKLVRWLKAGNAAVYAPDQDFNLQHAFLPFFGIPAATLVSWPKLVQRTGAMPLLFRHSADANGRLRLQLTRLEMPPDEPAERTVAGYNAWLEAWICADPSQYLFAHRRFKTRPPGALPLYPNRIRRRRWLANEADKPASPD
jgi:Kdo2-lipid IVA lauroyltransferase/acyltransferase